MRVFLDSARLDEVRSWLRQAAVDGVTTNPTLLAAAGVRDIPGWAAECDAALAGRPFCLEVLTDDRERIERQAEWLAGLSPRVVVKVPVITGRGEPCYDSIRSLSERGIAVNATACLSAAQAFFAARAGARYVSLFWGRIADEGGDPRLAVRNAKTLVSGCPSPPAVVVGSVREAGSFVEAALAGADVVTLSAALLKRLVDHHYGRATVQQFVADAASLSSEAAILEDAARPDAGGVAAGAPRLA